MSVNTRCSHHWTVTSECPKCLREQLNVERELRRRLRKRLVGTYGHPAGVGAVSAQSVIDWLDALERELLGGEEWKKWNETPFPFEEK